MLESFDNKSSSDNLPCTDTTSLNDNLLYKDIAPIENCISPNDNLASTNENLDSSIEYPISPVENHNSAIEHCISPIENYGSSNNETVAKIRDIQSDISIERMLSDRLQNLESNRKSMMQDFHEKILETQMLFKERLDSLMEKKNERNQQLLIEINEVIIL